jgi:hypothetical protein
LKMETMKLREKQMKVVSKVGRARRYGDLENSKPSEYWLQTDKQTNKVISFRQVSHVGVREEEGSLC